MDDGILKAITDIRARRESILCDEASIRSGAVMRLLAALGWDPFEVDQVKPEFAAGKRRVDFALLVGGKPRVFVEVEPLEADLDRRGLITQLAHAIKPGASEPDLVRLGIDMPKLREAGVEQVPGYFLASSLRPRELTFCNCINYGPNDGLDPAALTAAELDLRRRMFEIAEMFRQHVGGCGECYVHRSVHPFRFPRGPPTRAFSGC